MPKNPARKETPAFETRRKPAASIHPSESNHLAPPILNIGHSNRSIEAFLALLGAHGVQRLVDVRTVPRSRQNPQFNRDALPQTLRRARIAYTHLKKLGGLRPATADSPNTGWNNLSFRGFADYMQTPEFPAALARLEKLPKTKRCSIMCAEAVPWRCHRSILADALTVRGHAVEHIMTPTRRNLHKLTCFARVRGKQITYPATPATRAYAAQKARARAAKEANPAKSAVTKTIASAKSSAKRHRYGLSFDLDFNAPRFASLVAAAFRPAAWSFLTSFLPSPGKGRTKSRFSTFAFRPSFSASAFRISSFVFSRQRICGSAAGRA